MTTEVSVLYFAKSAELTGLKSETIRLPQPSFLTQRCLKKLTHDKLSVDAVSDSVTSPSSRTRNNFEGKKMVQLEYEAYVSMAQSELRKIYTDIRARLVPVTEASVIISISSPHRGDSLEAVQFCIDTLKAT
ncbi:unnamed protein product, partial [Coregonus sp. 'balchen']